MPKENRLREYTRSVWRQGWEAYERWPSKRRDVAAPAVDALIAELRRCTSEEELHARYWEPGDWPADVLRQHLPSDPGPEALLELEDASFWLRYRRAGGAAVMAAPSQVVCLLCGQPLTFTERGWVHPEGGVYAMRCPGCGWSGAPYPSPVRCPQCASSAVRDDHCALPQRS